MNTDWYQKSVNALTLAGKGERTVEAYTRALRMLVQFHHGKAPCDISQSELEAYFLHRRNVDHWSPNTMRICYCGIRFFFVSVLGRDWRLFQYLRARSESRLPAILSREEVRSILACVRTAHNHAFLSTVYACGCQKSEDEAAVFCRPSSVICPLVASRQGRQGPLRSAAAEDSCAVARALEAAP